jgi:hypothetical protein
MLASCGKATSYNMHLLKYVTASDSHRKGINGEPRHLSM